MRQLVVRHVPTARLKPWESNPRRNEQAVEEVAKSIKRFGFNVPVLCDEGFRIIAGHTRWKAAQYLEMSEVPIIVLPLMASDQTAFAIADNRTSQIAEWDYDELEKILNELRDCEAGLEGLGFTDAELAAVLAPRTELDWDDLEEYLRGCLSGSGRKAQQRPGKR